MDTHKRFVRTGLCYDNLNNDNFLKLKYIHILDMIFHKHIDGEHFVSNFKDLYICVRNR